jgi:addiction module RelE/StbE family toxin
MKLAFTGVFEADAAELSAYFMEQAGPGVAQCFEEELVRLAELLLAHPELGRRRVDLRQDGLRSLVLREFRNYVLFYRVEGDTLVFLRVRFGGMDLGNLFR